MPPSPIKRKIGTLIINSDLSEEDQKKFIATINRIPEQFAIRLLGLFLQSKEFIKPFWEITEKKIEALQNGKTDFKKIIEAEVKAFNEK